MSLLGTLRTRRWNAAAIGILVLAGVVILFLSGVARPQALPPVAYVPEHAALPPGLEHAGSGQQHGDDDSFVTREERYARTAAPQAVVLTVATTAYKHGRVVQDLEGRLSGDVYKQSDVKPQARKVRVRDRDGVLEVFPPRMVALTWIERPGVYVQVRGIDLTEQQVLRISDSLRER